MALSVTTELAWGEVALRVTMGAKKALANGNKTTRRARKARRTRSVHTRGRGKGGRAETSGMGTVQVKVKWALYRDK